jgi:hypothetical protein
MRVMARISMSATAGNRAVHDGTMGKIMQNTVDRWKPEAMYFTANEGKRCAYVIFDMTDSSDMPPFAEPFFSELDAEVELSPVMNPEDLQKGLSRLG